MAQLSEQLLSIPVVISSNPVFRIFYLELLTVERTIIKKNSPFLKKAEILLEKSG